MNLMEDKIDREIYWVLYKLRMITLTRKRYDLGYRFSLGVVPEVDSPTIIQQRKALNILHTSRVIKITACYNELRQFCRPSEGLTYFYVRSRNFHDYYGNLLEKLSVYEMTNINALQEGVELRIEKEEGRLFLVAHLNKIPINLTALRWGGVPRTIFDYLIDDAKGRLMTRKAFNSLAKINTSRDLEQIAIKAGFKGLLREHFMIVCDKDALQLRTSVNLAVGQAQSLLDELKERQA